MDQGAIVPSGPAAETPLTPGRPSTALLPQNSISWVRLTADAWYQYKHDARNRLVRVKTRHDGRTIRDHAGNRFKPIVPDRAPENAPQAHRRLA